MKHFRTYITYFFVYLFCHSLAAQNPKIEQARTNFIAQKIQLSSTEANKFWPVYNEYIDKMKAIRLERRKIFSNYAYTNNPAEAEAFIQKQIQLDEAELKIKKEYTQKFKDIIGIVKTAQVFKAEEEFRLELVKILKGDKSE